MRSAWSPSRWRRCSFPPNPTPSSRSPWWRPWWWPRPAHCPTSGRSQRPRRGLVAGRRGRRGRVRGALALLGGRLRLTRSLRHVRRSRGPRRGRRTLRTGSGRAAPERASCPAPHVDPDRSASTPTGRPRRRLRRRGGRGCLGRWWRTAGDDVGRRRACSSAVWTGPRTRPAACRPACRPGTPSPGRAATARPRLGPSGISVLIACELMGGGVGVAGDQRPAHLRQA